MLYNIYKTKCTLLKLFSIVLFGFLVDGGKVVVVVVGGGVVVVVVVVVVVLVVVGHT